MVNEKPKKVEKKSVSKKKSTVKKKATTVLKKKSPVKKATTAKVKKPAAKKVINKPAVKSKPKVPNVKKAATKVIKPAAKKPVKKSLKNVIADVNIDLKAENGSKTQNEKVVNVIDKLLLPQEQHYVTTVPGVFRKVPAVQKVPVAVHKEVPIAGILNYFKGIF